MEKENRLVINQHILISIDDELTSLEADHKKELEYVKQNFCGIVFNDMESFDKHAIDSNALVYVCGNIETNINNIKNTNIFVIQEFSNNYIHDSEKYKIIDIGKIPINLNNVGVYFRNFFTHDKDYFHLIENEHKFQTLTESNKSSSAFRTGIYLTKVDEDPNDEVKFKLLRCSTNLNGPTDNFRTTDTEVVNQVNDISNYFFEQNTELNHVLAQIYENKILTTDNNTSEKKAKIKKHSDKTKDMPRNGLMAFCSFYKKELYHKDIKQSKNDPFDYCYNDSSIFTKLRFELKKMVTDSNLKKKFDVILYPNSVFIMSLSANRLYTHEIIPSRLPIHKIPIRLGYVIRCSKTNAVFKNGNTYIVENDSSYVKMENPDENGITKLKELYYKENATDEIINYDKFYFSLNNGDYVKPII